MHLECSVPGIKTGQVDPLAREMNNIALVQQKLVNIGYSSGEIEYLIKQLIGGTKTKDLSIEKLRALNILMQQHLEFAKKCLDIP